MCLRAHTIRPWLTPPTPCPRSSRVPDFEAAGAELHAYLVTLPACFITMPEPYTSGTGAPVDPHRGWTDEERARVAELRGRERDLAAQLTHMRSAG